MPYLPDEFINEVLSRNDIIDVIGSYVQLTKKGNNFWGLCPFHNEKTPSFSVKQDQQFYYCFGCHSGGNVIQFIQKNERLDFVESVKFLAERVRMPLPETKRDKDYEKIAEKKELMYKAATDAAKFYHKTLNEPEGEQAMEYLQKRGLPPSIIKRFGLGAAPRGWQALKEYMNSLGYKDDLLHEIGLLGKSDKGYFDSLRGRVIFPIIDHRSRVVAFAGRVLDDSLPKYINSPETPIYNKRYVLYGAHYLRKIKNINSVMLVEGYMDVISLHKAGYMTAMASSGTALTTQQARLIKRYSDYVYICYDGDSAGQKATLRALDILHDEGLKVKVIALPENLDPDDFASRYGMAGINEQIEQASTRNDYKIEVISRDYDLESEEERKDFVIRVCSEVLSYIDSPTELAMYAKRLHMQTGFDEMVINQETQRAKRLHQNDERRQADIKRHNAAQSQPENFGPINAERKMKALVDAERLLFVLALNFKVCADILIKNTKKEDFMEGIHRDIAEVILNGINNNAELSAAAILGKLGESAVSEMAHALEMPYDNTRAVEIAKECLFKMHESKKIQQINEINRQLKDPMLNREKRSQLMNELLELRKQKTAYDVKGE